MVRLKHPDKIYKKSDFLQSQFHYGSIKTDTAMDYAVYQMMSQFHYGSIKTTKNGMNLQFPDHSLNSTMVRLKQFMQYYKQEVKIWSQFHYGSIKTKLPCKMQGS